MTSEGNTKVHAKVTLIAGVGGLRVCLQLGSGVFQGLYSLEGMRGWWQGQVPNTLPHRLSLSSL